DSDFLRLFEDAEAFLDRFAPKFFILEAGADALAGDPLGNQNLSPRALCEVTKRIALLANHHANSRLLVVGGGGYERTNFSKGWCAVVEALLDSRTGATA